MFMNNQKYDILKQLLQGPFLNQRSLAERTGCSLGAVNKNLHALKDDGYLDQDLKLTEKAHTELEERKTANAIILAAGFGMRMVPINLSTPKALLEVKGERLVERIIRQLHEAGITDITIVVGFMKESFEYLMDEYGVDLVVNEAYSGRNNLHSLALVSERIRQTYIIPCDLWCEKNPFSEYEFYSWYMVSDQSDPESVVRVNRKSELVRVSEEAPGNRMIGISYLMGLEASAVRDRLKQMDNAKHAEDFWEETLFQKDRMILQSRLVNTADVVEINTYEQLRELDAGSSQLQSDAIRTIAAAMNCQEEEITDISVLKKGMTNRSFLFSVKGKKYIMRIPGEGTDKLINREHEANVYQTIKGCGLCDDPVYINPVNGYKITAFLEGVRVCDPENEQDLRVCMKKLKQFHDMNLKVEHSFDVFGQIEVYESLWGNAPSIYRDYRQTKEHVLELKEYIEKQERNICLTHIDAVPDNFLFYLNDEGKEDVQLTDWEYSGMQDPHVDIAMFIIYSLYNKEQADHLIDLYFDQKCSIDMRIKFYCYIAACGMLWSNWCEYKRQLGVEFGTYSLRQYRYAKEYYRYARNLMEQEGIKE